MSGTWSPRRYVKNRREAHAAYLATVEVMCRLSEFERLPASIEQMAPVAAADHLLPLLVSRLRGSGLRVPQGYVTRARQIRAVYARESAGQERLARLVVSLLAKRDVRAMRYKGPSLGRRLFGVDGLRVSGDIDLIVDDRDLHSAAAIVHELGWLQPGDSLDARLRPRLHLGLTHPGGFWPVEVHWRVHWHEERFAADVLRRAVGDPTSLVPTSSDELLLLLVTFARDGAQRIRGLADIAAWYRLHGDDVGETVAEASREYPALASLLKVTERIVRHYSRLSIVRHDAPWTRSERLGFWLAMSPVSTNGAQRRADLAMFDLLVAQPGLRRRLIRSVIFPNRDAVAQWSGRGPSYRDAVLHSLRISGRLLLSLPRAWGRRMVCHGAARG